MRIRILVIHKWLKFYMKNILYVSNTVGHKTYRYFRSYNTNRPSERLEIRLTYNFVQCPCFWIRIRIPNTDSDSQHCYEHKNSFTLSRPEKN